MRALNGPGSNEDQAWDNINIEGSSKNIWIDHAEFWDGQDGNADVVKGADNVTFTWSIFGYSKTGSHTGDESVGASVLGVSNGNSCNVLTENNHFIKQGQPIDLGKQAGTGSVQEAVGYLFESCSGNQMGSGKAFTPPYEYKSFMVPAEELKALVLQHAGATLASPTACSSPLSGSTSALGPAKAP